MAAGHLLLPTAATYYILVALRQEERSLVAVLGKVYRDQRRSVLANPNSESTRFQIRLICSILS